MISGIDAMTEALDAIAAGEMRQTIKQDARKQAQGVYQMIEASRRGGREKGTMNIPLIPITKDNISQFRN